jgi:FSR family fosmidomycin resistance protein-like MFS transporter
VIRKFGEPTVVGSAALTAFVAAGVAGSLAGGWLADRWQRLATIRLGYAAAIPALAVLAVAPDVAVAFGAAIVAGLALFTPFAAAVTLGQDYLPNRIGTASGVTLGLAVSIGGLPVTLAVLACFPALSFAMTYRLREPRPGRASAGRSPRALPAGPR